MSIGTGIDAAAEGCPCGCGAAEKAHCWKESDWEESSAAKALRAENEHLRNVIAGLEQGNREAHQGIAKQKAANDRLRAEVERRRVVPRFVAWCDNALPGGWSVCTADAEGLGEDAVINRLTEQEATDLAAAPNAVLAGEKIPLK